MKQIFCFAVALTSAIFSNSSQDFASLSSEEMVFASKLSDHNRQKFCYLLSKEERTLAMSEDLSPDEGVEKIVALLQE
jgi:hypothetical protein